MTSGAVSSEYGETQVSARRTGVTSLNINERARTWATGLGHLPRRQRLLLTAFHAS